MCRAAQYPQSHTVCALRKAAWGGRRWGKGTALTRGPGGGAQREPGAWEGL